MTETRTYCDRCGKEVTYPVKRKLYLSGIGNRENYDLCDGCYGELYSWFKNEDKEMEPESEEEQTLAYADQDTLMPAT